MSLRVQFYLIFLYYEPGEFYVRALTKSKVIEISKRIVIAISISERRAVSLLGTDC